MIATEEGTCPSLWVLEPEDKATSSAKFTNQSHYPNFISETKSFVSSSFLKCSALTDSPAGCCDFERGYIGIHSSRFRDFLFKPELLRSIVDCEFDHHFEASNAMSSSSQTKNVLKHSSEDVGWEYGILANPTNLDKVKCKLCNKIISGGVHRLKHVANIRGNVMACTKSSDEDKAKCRAAIEEAKNKKKQSDKHIVEVREEVQLQKNQEEEEEDIEVVRSRKRSCTLEPMDRKEHIKWINVFRWVYEAGILFHAIDNDSFKRVMEGVGQFDPGIGNLSRFTRVVDKAKAFTIFIYAHHKTLALMRKHTKKRDIIRSGVTRFATSFLTLQSLMDKKKDLKVTVASDEWEQCKHVKTTKGKTAYATVVNAHFWDGVSLCLKVFDPLFKILRIVDGDKKPSMGFLHGELQKAKMEIKETFKNNEANYQPILQIIDEKAHERLDSPLHLASYLLNPYYFFKDQSIQHDPIVMERIFTCVEKFFPDNYEIQNQVINVEMHKYRVKEGGFGRHLAEIGCVENDENYNPVAWWYNYGNGVPNLQRMAIKILLLTTSSSGCERNWSSFEGIHTKKRNRLYTTRLNNLVYVQFNARILNKKKREKEKKVDILLASEASMAQGWIVEGGDEELELGSGIGETSEMNSAYVLHSRSQARIKEEGEGVR
ncbi:unnamed protein product [Malus baccata var. baccata]